MSESNLFADLPNNLPAEIVQTLASSEHCRIERIVSQGQASPEGFWYDQEQREWVIVLKGAGRICFADDATVVELKPGDFIEIAAHRKHCVEWTDPAQTTVWLAVYFD